MDCRAWISRPGDVCRRWNSAVAPDPARPRTRASDEPDILLIAKPTVGNALTTYNRSGLGLLFLISGREGQKHKIVISRFPTDTASLVLVLFSWDRSRRGRQCN